MDMDTAPLDGTRVLLKTKAMYYNSLASGYEQQGTRIIEGFYDPVRGEWRPWLGSAHLHSTNDIIPLSWAPVPEELSGD